MSAHPFGVEVVSGVLHVSGEVDMAVADDLLDAILRAGLTLVDTDLVVDLSAVTFLGSTGISVLVQARQQLSENSVSLRVVNPSPFVEQVFTVTGVSAYFGCVVRTSD